MAIVVGEVAQEFFRGDALSSLFSHKRRYGVGLVILRQAQDDTLSLPKGVTIDWYYAQGYGTQPRIGKKAKERQDP